MTPTATPLDVTIITGMSGAGRSEAAHVLEDLGFFVIDNLPPMLIGKVAELARGHREADRATRSSSTCARGDFLARPLGRDRRAAPPRRPHPRALPRRGRRRARAPLRGEPAPSPALRHRARQRRHRARARAARAARRARPTSSSTRRTSTCTSCATACASCSPSTATDARAAGQRRVVRLQARPARSTSTSCSTAASSRTRTGSTSCGRSPGSTRRCATTCSRQRGTQRVPRRARPPVRAAAARLRARGQGVPLDRRSAAPAAGTAAS